jgi:hypothetical protein
MHYAEFAEDEVSLSGEQVTPAADAQIESGSSQCDQRLRSE